MREFGDFQTPPGLVAAVLERLGRDEDHWTRVLEPTCGRGNFLAGLLALKPPPREILAVELQPDHVAEASILARKAPGGVTIGIKRGSLFEIDLRRSLAWRANGPLLVVGNPPWVTSAELGVLGSTNLPPKWNVKASRGIDAKTGAANFDIAEAVWIKLLEELAAEEPTIALLCKTVVARNVLEHAARRSIPIARASLVHIDARAWFGASVDACLLCITLKGVSGRAGLNRIPVFDGLEAQESSRAMGFARGRIVVDVDAYSEVSFVDGVCALTWRQGLKHDAATVMELLPSLDGTLRNKQGEVVAVEAERVYPLIKGTDLSSPGPLVPRHSVLVTQRHTGDDTRRLACEAPRLWKYLESHEAWFSRRRSSIYQGRPPFAVFGVGPYTFAPYKVAVSGLHRRPVFHALGPVGGRAVVFDDTCYFLPAQSAAQAALLTALLNGPHAIGLIRALSFPGAKRRITKAMLQRLDLSALLERADRDALLDSAGANLARLTGRKPRWPARLERLLEPDRDG
jgi:hypothetical protein